MLFMPGMKVFNCFEFVILGTDFTVGGKLDARLG